MQRSKRIPSESQNRILTLLQDKEMSYSEIVRALSDNPNLPIRYIQKGIITTIKKMFVEQIIELSEHTTEKGGKIYKLKK